MLGRKTYTQQELDHARASVERQLAVGAGDPEFFEAALLALDRRFVHRIRAVSGKDGNPLNEVELLVDSIMDNGGVLAVGTVIKYRPETSVLGLAAGDAIRLDADAFERLASAFLREIEARFL